MTLEKIEREVRYHYSTEVTKQLTIALSESDYDDLEREIKDLAYISIDTKLPITSMTLSMFGITVYIIKYDYTQGSDGDIYPEPNYHYSE